MFGYIVANIKALSEEQKKVYKSYYCGLCRSLRLRHGFGSRSTLSFDMTFLAVLLSGVYADRPEQPGQEKCFLHPIRAHDYLDSSLVDYAADMNILLSYYHFLDDWKDDRNIAAAARCGCMRSDVEKTANAHPRQSAALRDGLAQLSQYEQAGELNPDLPAECFGRIMAEIFTPYEDEKAPLLRRFGSDLGKFIYIMDACMDLKSDLKHARYNPLVGSSSSLFRPILDTLLYACTDSFRALQVTQHVEIIENVLYSGVWSRYEVRDKRKEHQHGSGSV